jgi:hypothetical protein
MIYKLRLRRWPDDSVTIMTIKETAYKLKH